jgi:uroporphyrinogen decarboxylase
MRQAGRYLPEFRALRAESDFFRVCRTPELACEVTLQPLRRFPLDAGIIFSDILVLPQLFGIEVTMTPGVGPTLHPTLRTPEDVFAHVPQTPTPERIRDSLDYVFQAIRRTVATMDLEQEAHPRVPLLGFSGAPWTLFAYMVEGGGSKTFAKAKRFLYEHPRAAHHALSTLSEVIVEYVLGQIWGGASAIQIFDSWAGELSADAFRTFSLPYLAKIADAVKARAPDTPLIVFAKGANAALPALALTQFDVLGVDASIELDEARRLVGPQKCLQGNMDPCVLFASDETIRSEVRRILVAHGRAEGLIFNLGHGMMPEHDPAKVAVLVEAVHSISKELFS